MYVWLSAFIAFLGTALLAFSPTTTTTTSDDKASRRRIHWKISDLWSSGSAGNDSTISSVEGSQANVI